MMWTISLIIFALAFGIMEKVSLVSALEGLYHGSKSVGILLL